MLELSFTIEGDTQLLRRLQGIQKDFKDWTPEFKKIGDTLLKTFKENFGTAGSLLGEPWQPLKPDTLVAKTRSGYPPDILIRTGKMRDSFKSMSGQYEVIVYNPTPYFKYHQSNQPRRVLPRRVMMKLDNKRKEIIVKTIQEAVQRKLSERSFVQ